VEFHYSVIRKIARNIPQPGTAELQIQKISSKFTMVKTYTDPVPVLAGYLRGKLTTNQCIKDNFDCNNLFHPLQKKGEVE
jgi:hypothetical protein